MPRLDLRGGSILVDYLEFGRNVGLRLNPGTTELEIIGGSLAVGEAHQATAGSALVINDDGVDADYRVEGDTNANLIFLDAAQDALSFGGANVDGAALTLNNLTTRTFITSVGSQLHIPAQTTNFDNASETIAIGAGIFIGVPTWTGDNATLTITDASTLYISGAPVDSTNVTATSSWALHTGGGDVFHDQHALTAMQNSGGFCTLRLWTAQASSQGPDITIRHARGTIASPTVVVDGDGVGNLFFQGHDGGTYRSFGSIVCEVDGSPGSGDAPGRIIFSTTLDGTTTLAEKFRIDNAGVTTITNRTAAVSAVQGLNLVYDDGAANADNDEIYISFSLFDDNATPGQNEVARITGIITDATDASVDGAITLDCASGDSLAEVLHLGFNTAGTFVWSMAGAAEIARENYTATTQSARDADTATTIGPLQDVVQTLIADLIAHGVFT